MTFKEHFWLADLTQKALEMPLNSTTSEIMEIKYKENPIKIILKNGTQLFFTFDEYRRIKNTPEIGKKMTIMFLQKKGDKSLSPSKILKCFVN